MNPITLRVRGVRGFRNETIHLGQAEDSRILVFGVNGSGKSTLVMALKLVLGHEVERLHQNYLPYVTENQITRTACIELDVLNPESPFYKADWPGKVTLGMEFGIQYNRTYRTHYIIREGVRQDIARLGDLREILRREPLLISTDDAMMFVTQGQITRYIDTTPRRRYEEIKEILGVEELERRWEEAIDHHKEANRKQADALLVLQKAEEILSGRRRLKEQYEEREHHRAEARRLWEIYYLHGAVQNARRLVELRREQQLQARAHSLAQQELEQALAEQHALEAEQAAREQEQRDLQAQVEALKQTATGHDARFRELATQADALEQQTQGLEDLPRRLPPREQVRAELDTLRIDVAAREAELRAAETRYREAAIARSDLAQQLGGARHALEQAQAEIARRDGAVRGLPAEKEVLEQLDALEHRRDELGQQQVSLSERMRAVEAELTRLRTHQVNVPEDAYRALEQYAQAFALAECLEVADPAARDFVEAALYPLRGAILTPNGMLHPYADYTIQPIPNLKSQIPNLKSQDDSLLRYVQVRHDLPEFARALAESILSRIRVAPAWQSDLAPDGGAAVATLDHYFVDHLGVRFTETEEYAIGRLGYEQAVVRQERTLSEARIELSACQAQREQLAQERERYSVQVRAWQDYAAVGDLRRQAAASTARQAELQSADEALAIQQTDLDERRGALRQALGQLQARNAELQSILKQWQGYDALAGLIARLEETRAQRAAARRERDLARQQQEHLTERIRELTYEHAIAEARLANIRGRVARAQAETDRLADRLAALVAQIADYEKVGEPFFAQVTTDRRPQTADQTAPSSAVGGQSSLEFFSWLVETYASLEEVGEAQLALWKNEATVHGDQAARIVVPEDAVQMYEVALAEAQERRKVMDEANSIVGYWGTQEEETRRAFEQMTNTYFNRINHRFQTYLEEFGWTGRIEREHRGGTRFDLDVLVSVEPERVAPTPVSVDSKSSGERAAIGFALMLAILKEFPRPFYVFDELDQNLDDINVGVVMRLLAKHLPEQKVLFFTPKVRSRQFSEGFNFTLGVTKTRSGRCYCKPIRFKDGGQVEVRS